MRSKRERTKSKIADQTQNDIVKGKRKKHRKNNKASEKKRSSIIVDDSLAEEPDYSAHDKNDEDFIPRSRTNLGAQNIVHVRTRKNKTVGSPNNSQPLVTSFLIRDKRVKTKTTVSPKTKHHAIMRQKLPESFRPIVRVIRNEQDEIIGGTTPDRGTYLRVTRDLGALIQLSNEPATPIAEKHPRIEEIDESHPFFQSDSYRDVVKFYEAAKELEITINKQTIQNVKDEQFIMNTKRAKKIRSVMGVPGKKSANSVSATSYITAVLGEEIKGEGIHNVGNQFLGAKSMVPENIIYGPKAYNTDMIFVETQVVGIAHTEPSGCRLKCHTELVPILKKDGSKEYLHMGIRTHMHIYSDKFAGIHFTLDAQACTNPHIVIKDYMNAFIKGLNEAIKRANKPSIPLTPLSDRKMRHLLFVSDDSPAKPPPQKKLKK